MSLRGRAALSVFGACAALTQLSPSRASDHLDGPRPTADPQADIADVFAFTSPDQPGRLVLAMTVAPFASSAARFAAGVDYVFRVRRVTALLPLTLDATVFDVTCAFDDSPSQQVACSAPGGRRANAVVGDPSGGAVQGPMRLFAGLRSDPSFFDRQGALATISAARNRFGGRNAFAGANVLAIVLEVDALAFAPATDAGAETGDAMVEPPRTTVAVAAETVRRRP